jgi:hypothetical protein
MPIYNALISPVKGTIGRFELYGKLAKIVGNNKGIILNVDDVFDIDDYFTINGIYDVNVLFIKKPCIGYFWNHGCTQYGLVCLKGDAKGNKQALKTYENNQ